MVEEARLAIEEGFPFRGGSYVVLVDTTRVSREAARRWFAAQDQPEDVKLRGGGGYGGGTIGSLVLEGGGSGQGARTPEGMRQSYGQGGGLAGYVLRQDAHTRVFVLAGGGGGGVSLARLGADRRPEPGSVTSTGGGYALFGLGVDLIIPIWKIRLLVGVRFGWQRVFGTPDSPLRSGPFLRVVVGPQFGQ